MSSLIPEFWTPYVLSFLLVLFRVAALVSLLPALGEASIPTRVKLVMSVCMSLIVFPIVHDVSQNSLAGANWLSAAIAEVGIGLWFGFMLRVFVFCLQIAGSIAAQSTSLSQILGSAGAEPLPALGHVITMAGMTLALSLGLHVSAVQYLIGSYKILPTGQLPDISTISEAGVAQIAWGFQLAFSLAAPFFILSLLYNLTLGVINRAMPQLMVAFVGAPVITAGALVLLAISIPVILKTWAGALFGLLNSGVIN